MSWGEPALWGAQTLKVRKLLDLPEAQPTRFEFAVNLDTAKTFGLTNPRLVLCRADEVIE